MKSQLSDMELEGFNYESPIQSTLDMMYENINAQFDNGVLRAVTKVGITVDKDELIRALQYDRGQYEKGYADGIAAAEKARPVVRVAARPLEEWHEDYGDVLWWKFPIEEPPYVGSPLDCNWSGYHTHWTPIEVPEPPNCGADMRGEEDG